MCDNTHSPSQFETAAKNALAAAVAHADGGSVNRDAAKNALDAAMSEQYQTQLNPLMDARATADDEGNAVAVRTHEAALDAARDELGGMFAAGYSRLNKALDGLENGTMTFQRVAFDPEVDNSGDVDYEQYGVSEGDTVTVVVSHKRGRENSRYVLLPTEGHSTCSCPDKQQNDHFPVCKHEMAWVLYQVAMPFATTTDASVDTAVTALGAADDESTAENQVVVPDKK